MKGRLIQARLHPHEDGEDAALAVYDERLDAGHTPRQIVRDALIALGGYPVYESDVLKAIHQVIDLFESRFDELKSMAPADRHKFVNEAGRSTFRSSIRQAVDVTDYEGDE